MSIKGKVKSWNPAKGFGFVISDKGDNEAFVHTSNIDGGILIEGKPVTYSTKASDRKIKGESKLVAVNLGGEGFRPKPEEKGKLKGVVKSWKHGKAMGFIKGGDGKDVYCHASAFNGGTLKPGKEVYYDLVNDGTKTRRAVAFNVSGPGVCPLGALTGTIEKWIPAKGYGFVSLENGENAFIHMSEVANGYCEVGKTIRFDVKNNNGKQIAVNISGPAVKAPIQQPAYYPPPPPPPPPHYWGPPPPPPYYEDPYYMPEYPPYHHKGGKKGGGKGGKGYKGGGGGYW
eukprot:TRINITY_DN464_c0_g1_i3.p1 TRINITY_DN464_c0_g1~~TRINITY_DN464_c0_g1_i3.p1  ORF type:complete len:286 (+),score=47.77 TRINITY_DN464_c0_g1_i3:143-1000(+)